MSESDNDLVFETTLDAPRDKVWRALTIPEYRDRWMAKPDDVEIEMIAANAGTMLTYRWKERDEISFVTIELTPQDDGLTGFRLTHQPMLIPAAANSNEARTTPLMRAA